MKKQKHITRVAVGMSGGVDSSLSAALLAEQGYEVTGVYLECWNEPGCRAPQDRKDALAVALQLGIPFEVLDFQKEYKKKVIDYFYREYKAGRTPNPDVVCNREIKFGLFLSWALEKGFDSVATGHYARVGHGELRSVNGNLLGQLRLRSEGHVRLAAKPGFQPGLDDQHKFVDLPARQEKVHATYHLLRGVDEKKDQSYFLYTLTQEQLKHILFPVGEMTKQEVRREAKKRGIVTADKPDSVGICFVGDVDVQKFLRRRIKEKRGVVADTDGNEIGEHIGVWFYTIGQRHGFSINSKFKVQSSKLKHAIPPFYVVGKDVTRNRLIVGFGPETHVHQFQVKNLHSVDGLKRQELGGMKDLRVRIRHGGELIPAELHNSTINNQKSTILVRLHEPVRGIAPGQAAVFYNGDECLGGGVIAG